MQDLGADAKSVRGDIENHSRSSDLALAAGRPGLSLCEHVVSNRSFDVPEEFDLDIEANLLSRRCRVAWKNSRQLGLKFISSIRS